MKYLIGDIGNSEVKLCILNKNFKIIKRLKIETSKIQDYYFFKKKIFPFLKNKNLFKKTLFSSVVPSVFKYIKIKLKKNFDIHCRELKQINYSKVIKLKANRKQIGSDRIANAIGCYYKYNTSCIVLDFGTATTFDVIKNGVYLGGIIAPGVNLSLKTLSSRAELIPTFTLKKTTNIIGDNTVSALRSGFYWGYIGLIENILFLIKKHTKANYKVILTGGYASLFKNSLKYKVFLDKDITIRGLIHLIKVY